MANYKGENIVVNQVLFPFRSEIQTSILALMLRNKTFISHKRHILSHRYFENPAYVAVAKVLLEFYDKYEAPCSTDSLLQLLSEKENYKLHRVVVDKITKADVSNADYISSIVVDFCVQQALRIALKLSEEAIKEKEYDKVLPLIEKALLQKEDNLLDGFLLSESVDKVKDYLSEDSRKFNKCATMISGVDKILRGGPNRKELHMVYAGTKVGKSVVLNNFENAAVLQGYNVTHVTLEMGDIQTAVRSNMRLSGMSDEDLLGNDKKWLRALKRTLSNGGDIYFKRFPNNVLTVKALGDFLDKLWKVKGYYTDVLILDYLTLLKPKVSTNNHWEDQGKLAEELRTLVVEKGLYCWSAVQGGKSAGSKESLELGDVRGSALFAQTVDSFWGLSRSEEEIACEPPRARFKNTALREGKGMGRTVNIIFDLDTMLMADLDEIDTPF